MGDKLSTIVDRAIADLDPLDGKFDTVVCAGDHHGIAIAAGIAAAFRVNLMIVCRDRHECVVSHITMLGDVRPTDKLLYVDDMFAFGSSLQFVMEYLTQSGEPVHLVGSYEANTREFQPAVKPVARMRGGRLAWAAR